MKILAIDDKADNLTVLQAVRQDELPSTVTAIWLWHVCDRAKRELPCLHELWIVRWTVLLDFFFNYSGEIFFNTYLFSSRSFFRGSCAPIAHFMVEAKTSDA